MKPRAKLRIALIATLLVLAIFLPEVVSAGWHIAHGRTVNYRSWKIVVPFGWYAMSRTEGMSVERMSELPWKNPPVATFLPVHFAKTFPFDKEYGLYAREQASTLKAWDYVLVGQQDVQIAGKDGRCWTFNNRQNHNDLWIACIVPKDLTSVDFQGSKANANDFMSFLIETKHNPAVTN